MKKVITVILISVILLGIVPCVTFADEPIEIVLDINGLGYVRKDDINLINKDEFDYTCDSFIGWTSGEMIPGSNFSIAQGYSGNAIFAQDLKASTAEGSINPYIPLPEHTGDEAFILSFRVYGDSLGSIEWSNGYLCDENKNRTEYVLGTFDGTNYRYGISASNEWAINSVAFTPKVSDKYIRLGIGWVSNIGIDDISIVKAENYMVEVTERYVTNETAHNEKPYILGCDNNSVKVQYGKSYVSTKAPKNIKVNNTEYVLISDITEKWVNTQSGEENGSIVLDYRYVKKDDLFVHPGALNTLSDLERIAEAVKNGEEPYLSGYNALVSNSYAQLGAPRAVGTITRGGTGDNCALLYRDAHRAYLCAIRWKISGDTAYADCARDILNAWSGTLKLVSGNADRYLAAGLYGYELACAAEIMRDYEGFELERMQDMLMNVFYPMNERFLYSSEIGDDHNGAHVMNYWANWDLCNMASSAAIGVFCDRRDIYERVLEYYKFGAGNGSVFNAVPKVYEASETTLGVPVGQWQEAGRDMEHTMMGVGLMATICEIAWNQGDDLYGWANNRFMYGAEYVAQYHTGVGVPYTTYYWYTGTNGTFSEHAVLSGQGGIRPVFEMIYNHYKNRKGIEMPGVKALLEKDGIRPEGGAASHGSSFDQFGFGTLLYTREEDINTAKLPEGNVKDGVYRIVNRNSGSAMQEDSDGYVRQYAVNENNDYQKWIVKDIGGGVYTVTNKATGKAMSIENDSYDLRALLKTEDYTGRFSQQFGFISFEDDYDKYYDGYYRIAPYGSGLSLDVRLANKADGTDILQYTYNSGYHQQWELVPVASDIKVNILSSKGEKVWIINAVYNKGDLIDRVESEFVTPKTNDETYTLNIEYDAYNEYVKTYVWKNTLEPAKFEIE